ncbi:MAG: hypothetical protein JWO13_2300 [Acidobacteriales bacterium]|nr:hypothetical protein [Terriglobales bacterium]
MHPSVNDYLVWVFSFGLQLAIAILIWRQKLVRRYPGVFTYVLFWVVVNPALVAIHRHYALYFYSYWAAQIVSYVLQVRIAVELFRSMARKLDPSTLRSFIVCVSAVAALFLSWHAREAHGFASKSIELLHRTQDALFFVRASIFALMLVHAKTVGLRNDGRNFKIAAGYGFYAAAALLLTGLQSSTPIDLDTLSLVRNWGYVVSLLMWIGAFRPRRSYTKEEREKILEAVIDRLETDLELLRKYKEDSPRDF